MRIAYVYVKWKNLRFFWLFFNGGACDFLYLCDIINQTLIF